MRLLKPNYTIALRRKAANVTASLRLSILCRLLCQELSRQMGIFRLFKVKTSEISLQAKLRGGARNRV
jgi:hypothetical protein